MSDKVGRAAILPLILATAGSAAGAANAAVPTATPIECTLDEEIARPAQALLEPTPRTIGAYHLLRELGSGGMGTVYLAESNDSLRRRVALKLIREELLSPELVARFEQERRALAGLDHDFVVRLFDSGTSDCGRPWLALEYVDGEPITVFCDHRGLDVETRLRLFVDVCEAVQHLHERGFLHCDLKPANILVQERSGRLVPKLIDLGLARRAGADDDGHVMGTPAYMAPEQFTLRAEDLDSRCDVFALGLVLRELLIGVRPVPGGVLSSVRRTWLEERPRPRAELPAFGEEGARIARCRGTRSGRLARRLRGTLDDIAQRASSVRRDARHASVAALAAAVRRDLERHAAWQRARRVFTIAAASATAGFLGGFLALGG